MDLRVELRQLPMIKLRLAKWAEEAIGVLLFIELHVLTRQAAMSAEPAPLFA